MVKAKNKKFWAKKAIRQLRIDSSFQLEIEMPQPAWLGLAQNLYSLARLSSGNSSSNSSLNYLPLFPTIGGTRERFTFPFFTTLLFYTAAFWSTMFVKPAFIINKTVFSCQFPEFVAFNFLILPFLVIHTKWLLNYQNKQKEKEYMCHFYHSNIWC